MIYRIYFDGKFLMNLKGWSWEVDDMLAEIRENFECDIHAGMVDLL